MSFLGEDFNADELPDSDNVFDPVPAGWYDCTIAAVEDRKTKAGNGKYLSVRYTIVGPTHQGRMFFGNINYRNPSAEAEKIGRAQLGEIMRAIGLASLNDSDQLIGGSLKVKVVVRKDKHYGDSNEPKGFKALAQSSMPASSGMPPIPTPAAPPSAGPEAYGSTPPWARK